MKILFLLSDTLRMKKSLLSMIWLLTLSLCYGEDLSNTAFHEVSNSLTIESTTNKGDKFQLGHDTYLRQIYEKDQLGSWAVKVMIVDEDNVPVSDDIYRTSRKYFNKSVAVKFNQSIQVLDEKGKGRNVPAGTRLVRVKDVLKGNWKYYSLVMVNDQGQMLDWSGKPTNHPPVLKTSIHNYDIVQKNSRIQDVLTSLVEEKKELETHGPIVNQVPHCDTRPSRRLAPKVSTTPRLSPPKIRTRGKFWRGKKTPYNMVMSKRRSLKKLSKKQCERKRRNYERKLLSESSWGHLNLDQRAQKIYQVAKESLAAIKEVSNDRGGSSNYTNSVNANYISPIISPELVTCIAFQETSGSLNPFAQNYSYCKKTKHMVSTAHGLGQMTRGTFLKMKNHPDSDQLPYSTKYSAKLRGKSIKQAHKYMSIDPHLQLEVSLRLLNFEAKYSKWRHHKSSNAHLLKMAVTRYDHDNKSKYVKNVYDHCIPCLSNKSKSAKECYHEIWD